MRWRTAHHRAKKAERNAAAERGLRRLVIFLHTGRPRPLTKPSILDDPEYEEAFAYLERELEEGEGGRWR